MLSQSVQINATVSNLSEDLTDEDHLVDLPHIDFTSSGQFPWPKVFDTLVEELAQGYSERITSFNVFELSPS